MQQLKLSFSKENKYKMTEMNNNYSNDSSTAWWSKISHRLDSRAKCFVLCVCVCVSDNVPRLSVYGSGAWPGPRRWRRPCCSLHVHTRTASLRCVTVGESWGSPGESKLWHSPQTADRQTDRQTDRQWDWLPECSRQLVRERNWAATTNKALCVSGFSNVIYSWTLAHLLSCATLKHSTATLWWKGLLWDISKLSVRQSHLSGGFYWDKEKSAFCLCVPFYCTSYNSVFLLSSYCDCNWLWN